MGVRVALIAAWLTAFVASRFALVPYVINPDAIDYDSRLNACITPWKLITGLPVKEDYYLADLSYVLSYWLFDYGPDQARLATIPFFAIALCFYGLAFRRMFGGFTAVAVMLLVMVTIPFVILPAIPVYMCSGFWLSGPVVYLLTFRTTNARVVMLSVLMFCSMFAYASGTVLILPFVAGTIWLFWRSWGWKRAGLLGTLCLGWWFVFEWIVRRPGDKRLGMSFVTLDPERWMDGSVFLAKELFRSANSWYAFSGGHPFVPVEVTVLAGVSVALLLFSGAVSRQQKRWVGVCLVAVVGSILLVGFANRTQGIRRIVPATILMFPVAMLSLQILWDKKHRFVAVACLAGFLSFGAWKTQDVLENATHESVGGQRKTFPVRGRQDVSESVRKASDDLQQRGYVDRVVFVGKGTEVDSCTFYFTKRNRGRFGTVEAVPTGTNVVPLTPDETIAIYEGAWK